jgi:hypothetical protein
VSEQDELVLLGATDELEAAIWRDILEEEGIAVFVKKAEPLAVLGITPPVAFEVYVRAADERRARWLLGEGVEPAG